MGVVATKNVRNALVYYDNAAATISGGNRWYDAIGPGVTKYIYDGSVLAADDSTTDPVEFVNTVVEVGAGVNTCVQDDVAGGGTTQTVGVQVTDFQGKPINYSVVLEFAVFDDLEMAVPATDATLDTEAEGTILAGAGSAALKVKTDANGRFSCTLTDSVLETVYVGCSMSFGSRIIDCGDPDSVTFSA